MGSTVVMKANRISTAMKTVQNPKTMPLSVHNRMSIPMRNPMSAISKRTGIEAMIAGIFQAMKASYRA